MTNDEAINILKQDIDISFQRLIDDDFLNEEDIKHIKAYEMAIDALKNKWIPVSDRVPEDDRLVIVCTESGQVYTDYYFDDKPDFWELAHIIAWQDLPMSWQDSLKTHKKEDSE